MMEYARIAPIQYLKYGLYFSIMMTFVSHIHGMYTITLSVKRVLLEMTHFIQIILVVDSKTVLECYISVPMTKMLDLLMIFHLSAMSLELTEHVTLLTRTVDSGATNTAGAHSWREQ